MKKRMTTLLLAATTLFTACEKSIEKTSSTSNNLAGTYKVTALVHQQPAGTTTDLFSTLPECQKKNVHRLNSNFSYQFLDYCDPAENQNGIWKLNANNKIMINGLEGDLLSNMNNTLVISFPGFMGLPGTVTETLTRQ